MAESYLAFSCYLLVTGQFEQDPPRPGQTLRLLHKKCCQMTQSDSPHDNQQFELRWKRNNLKSLALWFTVVTALVSIALFIAAARVNEVANDLESDCGGLATRWGKVDVPSVVVKKCVQADDRNRMVTGFLTAASIAGAAAVGLGIAARAMDDHRPQRGYKPLPPT